MKFNQVSLRILLALFCGGVVSSAASGQIGHFDGSGRLAALSLDGQMVPVITDARVFLHGWTKDGSLGGWSVRNVQMAETPQDRRWSGTIVIDEGKEFAYEQSVRELAGGVEITLRLTSLTDANIEEPHFCVQLPVAQFAGGTCILQGEGGEAGRLTLPATLSDEKHLLSGPHADRATFTNAADTLHLEVVVEGSRSATLQDGRRWKNPYYDLFFPLPRPAKGQSVSCKARLKLTGTVDRSPVELALDANVQRYRLDGLGGNYCFNSDGPVTDYTLKNLAPRWARIEFKADDWWPRKDDANQVSHDSPTSRIGRDLALARRLAEANVPCVMSVWFLPEWLYGDPGKGREAHGRHVPRQQWQSLKEVVGSYLLHAKEHYGVEPRLFSFNEADYGVRVKLDPNEARDMIQLLGEHFRKLGLSTRMLLGDTTVPQKTLDYIAPTLQDPEAMQYVGAISFHSWSSATPREYGDIAAAAREANVPLLVTEVGVDAEAWHTPQEIQSWYYALRELRMYQELLLYACPQGMMQWQFTNDYPLLLPSRDAHGVMSDLQPTSRFWFIKHFCSLTPSPAASLLTRSSAEEVLFTAFEGLGRQAGTYVLHVANLGPARAAHVQGLPPQIQAVQVITSGRIAAFATSSLRAQDGRLDLDLPAQSLVTLVAQKND